MCERAVKIAMRACLSMRLPKTIRLGSAIAESVFTKLDTEMKAQDERQREKVQQQEDIDAVGSLPDY